MSEFMRRSATIVLCRSLGGDARGPIGVGDRVGMSERAEKVVTGADEDVGVWTEEETSGDWVGRGRA